MIRQLVGLCGLSLAFALATPAAHAQSYTYSVYVNRDGNTATGCNAIVGAETFAGAETRLDVAVTGGGAPSVTGVTRAECANGTFTGAGTGGTAAIGLNTGAGGADVVEIGASLTAVGDGAVIAPVGVSAAAAGSTDALFPNGFGVVLGGSGPLAIPGLGILGALVLVLAVVLVARRGLRKRRAWFVGALAFCGIAVAANFIVDGQVGDWAGVTPVTDAVGDSTGNNGATDLLAAYAATEGGTTFFRIDVRDLQNQSPVAVAPPAAFTTPEDTAITLVLSGTDPEGDPVGFSVATPPARGTLSAFTQLTTTTAQVTYTPNPDTNGADAFTFRTNDGSSFSQPAVVSINVTPVNDAPAIANQSFAAVENSPNGTAIGTVAVTDADVGQAYAWAITGGNTNGAFAINATTGAITVANSAALDPIANPSFTLTVTATDNGVPPLSATGLVSITVTGINDAPTFTPGASQAINEDAGDQTVAWATAISDNDGNTQTLSFQVSNTNAALFAVAPAISPTGTLTYRAGPNANGVATVTVVLRDNGGTVGGGVDASAPVDFTITVAAVNDAPAFVKGPDQSILQSAASPQSVLTWATGITAGPADESGQVLAFVITGNTNPDLFDVLPAIAPNGTLTFDPKNTIGAATLTVVLSDDGGTANGGVAASAPQTFVISVDDVNDAPSFTAGPAVTVSEDAPPYLAAWATNILAGPSNEASQTVQFELTNDNPGLFSAPVAITSDGTLGFTVVANASGVANVTVRLRDSGGTASGGVDVSPIANLVITVDAVNDAPTFTGSLVTVSESATPTQRTQANWATFSGGAPDEAGQVATAYSVSNVTNAALFTVPPAVALDGALTFTTAAQTSGSSQFTVTVTDNGTPAATSAPQVFTINITGVNDAPVVTPATFSIAENSANATNVGTATATDPDAGQTLTWAIAGGNTGGAFAIDAASGAITVANSAALDFEATPSFSLSVQATDDGTPTLSGTGTITIGLTDADDAPVALPDAASVAEDSAATPIDVLSNDTDVDAVPGPKSILSVTQPGNGTVVITGGGSGLTYQPLANYCNSQAGGTADTFTYTLSPTGTNATTTVSITVVCVTDDATAIGDTRTVDEDSGVSAPLTVLANDTNPDNATLTITAVTQPSNGIVAVNGAQTDVTYTPNAGYCNTPPGATLDTFTYTIAPGGSTATVSMRVLCSDDPPTAVNDAVTVAEDSSATTIAVTTNDTDTDGGAKNVASITQPTSGVAAIVGNDVTYTPNANYCNTPPGTALDTFTYTLAPGGSTATVSVTVTCVDDNPTGVADAATVSEDSAATAIDVLANDTDPDGGTRTISAVGVAANGTVAITNLGADLTYTPNANYCNSNGGPVDTFSYTISPGGSTASVAVTVTCVDDVPVAITDTATVNEDSTPNVIDVLANDIAADTDGGPISIASVTAATNGTVVNGASNVTYTPNANFCGTDSFGYTLTPGTSSTTVNVTVTCVDDPPVASPDAATVLEDSAAAAVIVLTNDNDPDGGPKTIAAAGPAGNGLVVVQAGGTGLTYQPTANYCNTQPGGTPDTFSYTLSPGSSSTVVSITVTCVNDAPTAVGDTWSTIGNTELRVDLAAVGVTPNVVATTVPANGVRSNDADLVENDPLTVSSIVGCADVAAPYDCTLPAGHVVMEADGKFRFTPNPAAVGPSVTFQYVVTDAPVVGTPANATGTVTINLAQRVWYVDGDAGVSGNGTSESPFTNFSSISGAGGAGDADAANDIIFVHDSTVSGSIELENGQKLWGEGFGLAVPVSVNGGPNPTVLVGPGTRPNVSSPAGDAVRFSTAGAFAGIEVRGLNLAATAGNAIGFATSGAGSFAAIVRDVAVTAASSAGIDVNQVSTGSSTLHLQDINVTSTGNAIDLARTGGALTVTTLRDITVSGNSGAAGIIASGVAFDAVPGGAINALTGGTMTVGSAGNPVGGAGMTLSGVTGQIDFTNLAIESGGAGLTASGPNLTLRVNTGGPATGTIVAGTARALDVSLAALDMRLVALSNAANGAGGLRLANVTGTLTANTGSLSTNAATATLVDVANSSATVTYDGALQATAGTGVLLATNTGGVTFRGGMVLTTGANAAFSANGGGTVTVCDENPCNGASTGALVNTLATTTAVALNVVNTNIGSALEFRSIGAGTAGSGPANGIVLNNTGGGPLRVLGNGGTCTLATPTCTGGTIQNTTGDGILLNTTVNPTFALMRVLNAGGQGLNGFNVNGATVRNSVIDGAGNADEENGILFGDAVSTANGLVGTALIQDVAINAPIQWGVRVRNASAGTLNLTMRRVTVTNNINVDGLNLGEHAVSLQVEGGTSNVLVDDSDFLTVDAGITGGVANAGTLNLTVQNTVVNQSQALPFGINFVTANTAIGRLNATGNTLTGCTGVVPTNLCSIAIDLDASGSSQLDATVQNNTISATGIGGGIEFIVNENAIGRGRFNANNITLPSGEIGMNFLARALAAGQAANQQLTITNNVVSGIDTAFFPAFALSNGSSGAIPQPNNVCVNVVGSNTVNGTTATDVYAFTVRKRTGSTFNVQGYAGAGDRNTVAAFFNAANTGGSLGPSPGGDAPGSRTDVFPTGGTTVEGYTAATCATPTLPTTPP